MDERGNQLNEMSNNARDENEQQQEKGPADKLADIFDRIADDNEQLVAIVTQNRLMIEAMQETNGRILEINISLRRIANEIGKAVGVEKPEPEAPAEPPAVPVEKPVHGSRFTDGLALCGAQGSKAQPYLSRLDEQISSVLSEITCPECLEIVAEKQKTEEKV